MIVLYVHLYIFSYITDNRLKIWSRLVSSKNVPSLINIPNRKRISQWLLAKENSLVRTCHTENIWSSYQHFTQNKLLYWLVLKEKCQDFIETCNYYEIRCSNNSYEVNGYYGHFLWASHFFIPMKDFLMTMLEIPLYIC